MEQTGVTGGGGSAVHAAVAGLSAAVEAALGVAAVGAFNAEVPGLLLELAAVEARVAALSLRVIAQAEARGLPAADGATSTAVWLRHLLRLSPGEAATRARLARSLDLGAAGGTGGGSDGAATESAAAAGADVPAGAAGGVPVSVGAALWAGRVSLEHARVMARTLAAVDGLAGAVPAPVRGEAEGFLIGQALELGPDRLAILGRFLRDTLDVSGGADLEARERAQHAGRSFSAIPDYEGMLQLRGALPKESGALLLAVLDPLAAPRPAADGTRDPRTATQRRADALIEMTKLAAASGGVPAQGGNRACVLVTMTLEALRAGIESHNAGIPAQTDSSDSAEHGTAGDGCAGPASVGRAGCAEGGSDGHAESGAATAGDAGAGGKGAGGKGAGGAATGTVIRARGREAATLLPSGQPLSAAAARRLACDAELIAVVLGSESQVLDIGRATRQWTWAQQKAVAVRDGGCIAPGCDRPPGWCQLHHIRYWSRDGATAVDNAAMLCDAHHDSVHHHGWTITMGADGHPRMHPPTWIPASAAPPADPHRRWRRQLQRLAYLHGKPEEDTNGGGDSDGAGGARGHEGACGAAIRETDAPALGEMPAAGGKSAAAVGGESRADGGAAPDTVGATSIGREQPALVRAAPAAVGGIPAGGETPAPEGETPDAVGGTPAGGETPAPDGETPTAAVGTPVGWETTAPGGDADGADGAGGETGVAVGEIDKPDDGTG